MNSSVSPLPIPIWPMLGLSLSLVATTATAVTFSGQRANRNYLEFLPTSLETKAPALGLRLTRKQSPLHARINAGEGARISSEVHSRAAF